jgi:cobalt/nickel transport system permease protein
MHVPDGFLTNRIAVTLDVISCANILYAARRVKLDFSGRVVPVMGVLAAFVFAAQMLNFPILGGTSGHLIGGSLLAILLGPMAGFLTMATVILAQALFLQDGGLIALGANLFNICAIPCFSGYAVFKLLRRSEKGGRGLFLAGFLAGWSSLIFSSAFCAIELSLSAVIPLRIGLTTMVGYHAVLGVFEGMLTAGVLGFLFKVRPDLMKIDGLGRFGFADWVGAILFVAVPASILVMAGSSTLPDPLEKILAFHPLLSEAGDGSEELYSVSRYRGYAVRAAVFLFLIGLGILAGHIARRRRGRS